jgi:dihydroflavonol-4-reductase
MEPDPWFWAGKRVCVTGGTGFLGWHLVRQLQALTPHVRVFGLRPASALLLECMRKLDWVEGDIRDADAVCRALRDCDVVLHAAGPVAVWGPALRQLHDTHVQGTRHVLAALPVRARLVHTSSVVAVGASTGRAPLTEDAPFGLQRLRVDYVHAKRAAEDVALTAAARQDVVVVNPAYLLGPGDYQGSPLGRLCLRFWKHKLPLVPGGGLNFVDVRDAARGHLLAAERGVRGRRYILGGENLTFADFVNRLAAVRGLPPRRRCCVPWWLQAALARFAELRAGLLHREPYPSVQQARMSRYYWYYSAARAAADLGYRARPLQETLTDLFAWFCQHRRLRRCAIAAPTAQPAGVRAA